LQTSHDAPKSDPLSFLYVSPLYPQCPYPFKLIVISFNSLSTSSRCSIHPPHHNTMSS
jgi:hypothetical protein